VPDGANAIPSLPVHIRRRPRGALVVAFAAPACSSGDDGPAPFTGRCPPGDGELAPVAMFDPFGDMADRSTPIPNDVWTVADPLTPTGLRLAGEFSSFDAAFSLLDGFGLAAPIAAPFSGVLDPATLAGTAGASTVPRLFLLDLAGLGTPGAADFAARLVPVESTVAQTGSALVFPSVASSPCARSRRSSRSTATR